MSYVKNYCLAKNKEEEYEVLAKQVNFNIEEAAQKLIKVPDKLRSTISIIYDNGFTAQHMPSCLASPFE